MFASATAAATLRGEVASAAVHLEQPGPPLPLHRRRAEVSMAEVDADLKKANELLKNWEDIQDPVQHLQKFASASLPDIKKLASHYEARSSTNSRFKASSMKSPSGTLLPDVKTMRRASEEFDLSIIIEYYNANDGRHHETSIPMLVKKYRHCSDVAGLKMELIVNVDSRKFQTGDAKVWVDNAGPDDYIMLSPDIHELRAYNRMADLARGKVIFITQDDEAPPNNGNTCEWLGPVVRLLGNTDALSRLPAPWPSVRVIGLHASMAWIKYGFMRMGVDGGDEGPSRPREGTPGQGRCRTTLPCENAPSVHCPGGLLLAVEAVRCADLGPILINREAFVAMGGFNETIASRDEFGSVEVDCGFQARMWEAGYATITAMPPSKSEVPWWSDEPIDANNIEHAGNQMSHMAWQSNGMMDRHQIRQAAYGERYESGDAGRAIDHGVRSTNAYFDCSAHKEILLYGTAAFPTRRNFQGDPYMNDPYSTA